jgi:hypothetical protein
MKAICLSGAATLILLGLVTLVFRLNPRQDRGRRLLFCYLVFVAVLICVWWSTPGNLGFLPRALLAEPQGFDLGLTLFFFSAAFFGGVLQLYNLADRGLSLRILIDALDAPNPAVSADRLMREYGGGRGLIWMYDKRMQGLVAGAFVRRAHGAIALTAKGAAIADLFIRIRRFLNLELA